MKTLTCGTSSAPAGFIRGKTLYKETTTKITTRDTKVIPEEYSPPNVENVLNRQNSSLYTGSIFAAFNYDLQVKSKVAAKH